MNCLSVENISKSFGEKVLFEGISFGLNKGQKSALVAKNGAGKTTLMRILAGQEAPDTGAVAISQDIRVGFLEQEPAFEEGETAIDYVFRGGSAMVQAVKKYELALEAYESDASQSNLDALQAATMQMDNLQAWDLETKISQVLSKLNIHQLQSKVHVLSGGQKKRLALGRVLIEEPDLLVLDEPTNHLDLDMIEWLEEFLSRQTLTLLLVTHDRLFLDNVCNEVIELENNTLYRHQGDYSLYLTRKNEREITEAKEVDKAKNLLRKELEWARRMPKARGTKAKYRLDGVKDLQEKAGAGKHDGRVEISAKMSRMGKKILELHGVSKSYGENRMLDDFNYIFRPGEKIGIVGKNGVGKSTFLDLITDQTAPDSGEIVQGETLVFGYYQQAGIQFDEGKRVIDAVREIAEVMPMANGSELTASQLLQLFLFPPKMQYVQIHTLSGGEKRRLYLLTVLMKNPNFLILDEPTNDLDLPTIRVLEDFLQQYAGCLLVVTHDRFFLDQLADHLFIFEGEGKIKDFNGRYLAYRAWQEEQELAKAAQKEAERKKSNDTSATKPKRTQKGLSYKEQREFDGLEAEIEKLESEKAQLNEDMQEASSDHEKLQALSERIAEHTDLIEEKTFRWMELSEKAEG